MATPGRKDPPGDIDETQPLLSSPNSKDGTNGAWSVPRDHEHTPSPGSKDVGGQIEHGRGDGSVPSGDGGDGDRDGHGHGEDGDPDPRPASLEATTLEVTRTLAPLFFGTFLAAVDTSLLATLSGPISSSFRSLRLLSWLATSYIIANAATQPLAGKLSDIFGRRASLLFVNAFFLAGNLICGIAPTEGVMIFGRVVAGVGGGCLNTLCTIVASDVVPLRKRGLWMAYANVCWSTGAAVGGAFGGWVNDSIGWRWAFLIQVPLTAACIVAVWLNVNISQDGLVGDTDFRSRIRRVDFVGALVLIAAVVLLLFGLNSGGNTVPWTHPLPLTTIPLSVLFLALYVYIETVVPEPIIPVRLMLRRTVWACQATNWLGIMTTYGVLYFVPVYLQALGMPSSQVGLRTLPYAVCGIAASLLCGVYMRQTGRYHLLGIAMMLVLVAGLALCCLLDLDASPALPFLAYALSGAGISGMLSILTVALIAAVDQADQAVVTAAAYAIRSIGAVVGITVASAVFQNVLGDALDGLDGLLDGGAHDVLSRVRDSLDAIADIPPEWRLPVVRAYMLSLRAVFQTLTGIGVLATLMMMCVKEHRLYNRVSRDE